MLLKAIKQQSVLKINDIYSFIFHAYTFSLNNIPISITDNYSRKSDECLALENVIIEENYISDITDQGNETGDPVTKSPVTYRIYINIKPAYSFQLIYENQKRELHIKTSSKFPDNKVYRAITGFYINPNRNNENLTTSDYWIAMGASTRIYSGILRSEERKEPIINKNETISCDRSTKDNFPNYQTFDLDLNFYIENSNPTSYSTNDRCMTSLIEAKSIAAENKVLIAQLTTNSKLTFELNIQSGVTAGVTKQRDPNNTKYPDNQINKLISNLNTN